LGVSPCGLFVPGEPILARDLVASVLLALRGRRVAGS
jgi:hypothetical protein